MKILINLTLTILLISITNSSFAAGSNSVSIEYRLSRYDESLINENKAKGVQISYSHEISNFISAYFGWSYDQVDHIDTNSPDLEKIEKTGYTIGGIIGKRLNRIYYGGYGGLTYKHYELDLSGQEDPKNSGHDLGYEFGVIASGDIGSNVKIFMKAGYENSPNEVSTNNIVDEKIEGNYILSMGAGVYF